jgi:hypothetical protein
VRTSIYTLALARAAEVEGGAKALAKRLCMPAEAVQLWIDGRLPTPGSVFLKAVDILLERSLACLEEDAHWTPPSS